MTDELQIETIESMPFAENTYIANLPGSRECVVIDPGLEPDLILDYLRREQLTPAAILLTHGHCDHIAGIPALKKVWPQCPALIGRGDADCLTDPRKNLSAQFGLPYQCEPADRLLEEGEIFAAAGIEFETVAAPGHSVGHVVFLVCGRTPTIVFGGDVLFAGSIGRSDFPGGDFAVLARTIREKLYTLPDDTVVYPGHGAATTIGQERQTNPFVKGKGI